MFETNNQPFNLDDFNEKWQLHLPLPLLKQSLTHRSIKAIKPSIDDNQRLETLGDAVIDLIVLNWLFHEDAENEGILTKSRAEIVKNETLAEVGQRLQIVKLIFCAPNYQVQEKDLADVIEAIFGAIFLSHGLKACQEFLLNLLGKKMIESLQFEKASRRKWGVNEYNPKNLLQEFFQKNRLPTPIYTFIQREGSDHEPIYHYKCEGIVDNIALSEIGAGKTKKEAQKNAARMLFKLLQEKGYIPEK